MTTVHMTFDAMPPMMRTLARGLMRRRKGLRNDFPSIRASVSAVATDATVLREYRALCDLPDNGQLPVVWPQLLAGPLHMQILAHRDFPWSALGIVHMGQQIRRHVAIPQDALLDLTAFTTHAKPAKRGAVFGLRTQARIGDQQVWESDMQVLVPGARLSGEPVASTPLPALDGEQSLTAVEVPEDTGRRYRRVSGDANPIHMHRLAAKLFGFKQAIAHGTWTLARAVGPVPDQVELTARFRKPVFLPSTIDVVQDGNGRVQVRAHASDRVLVDIAHLASVTPPP